MFGVILLPDFALQAALRHQPVHYGGNEPCGVLAADASDKPVIYQLNAAARRAGVQAGMTSSQGLGRYGRLQLRTRLPAQEATLSEALLESAFSCSPWVEATGEGICTFEIRNCQRFDFTTGQRLVAGLARLELEARVGFASNPDMALLAAHAAQPCLVVDDSRAFLADLPLTALDPMPGMVEILRRWGIETLGALTALPPDEVTRRLGVEGHDLWQRAAGRRHRLLRLARVSEAYEESVEFEYEIQTLEPLLFVLRRFLDQLVARMEVIYRVPAILDLRLGFEDGNEYGRVFRIPAPTGNVETLFRVIHTHLENFTAPSPIRRLRLAAVPALANREQFGLFETALRDPNRFSETLARLHALLGSDRAGIPCRENTHRPDAFHLEAPDFLNLGQRDGKPGDPAAEPPEFGLPLHRTRPPLPIRVEVSRQAPSHIDSTVVRGQIRSAYGPYQIQGGWWDCGGWDCEEWDVELAQGGLYRLNRQSDEWFLTGIYG